MALGIFVGLHGGGSSGCSIGGADGSTGGLLGVEVGTVEGEFDGSVLGFRLGTSNHDGKAMGAKVGEVLDNTGSVPEVEFILAWMGDCLDFSEGGYLVSMVVWQRGGHLELWTATSVAACVVERWRVGAKAIMRARVGREIRQHISDRRKVVRRLSIWSRLRSLLHICCVGWGEITGREMFMY